MDIDETKVRTALRAVRFKEGEFVASPDTWAVLVMALSEWLLIHGLVSEPKKKKALRKREKGLEESHAYLAGNAGDTSTAAYERALENSVATRAQVWALLRSIELGLTDEQQQTILGMSANTQRPRRLELVEAGLVKDSGQRRKTSKGNDAIVWKAMPL